MIDLSRRSFTLGLLASAAAVPAVAGATVEDPFLVGMDVAAKPDVTAIAVFRWSGDKVFPPHARGSSFAFSYVMEVPVKVVDGNPVIDISDLDLPKDRPVEMQVRMMYPADSGHPGIWNTPIVVGHEA
jgi:hypothetical protein